MNCKEFRNRIGSLLESDESTQELRGHMARCPECAEYYRQTQLAVESLVPRAQPVAPETIGRNVFAAINGAEPARSKRPLGRFYRVAAIAASMLAVAALAVVTFATGPAMAGPRADAARIFGRAADSTQPVGSMVLTLDVRTSPHDNFEFIDTDREMVAHAITVVTGNPGKWRIDKGGRVALFDGERQYMWTPPQEEGVMAGPDAGFVEWFRPFLDPATLLRHEKEQTGRRRTRYTVFETDSAVFLTVKAKPRAKRYRHGYLLNSSIDDAENRREYVFDRRTGLLRSLQVFIRVHGCEKLILETTGIAYDVPVAEDLFTAPEGYVWGNVAEAAQGGLPADLSPKEAAETILRALSERQAERIGGSLPVMGRAGLVKQYAGSTVVRIGKPFRSGMYPGWFVPYEIVMHDGTPRKGRMAVRNDNPDRLWQLDGGM